MGDIQNTEVEEQIDDVESQISLAVDVQGEIDLIDNTEIRLDAKEEVEQIGVEIDEMDNRYARLLDTDKYHEAVTTIDNLEGKTDVGEIILAIDAIGDVSLSSETEIKVIRSKYDDLTYSEQKEVINSGELILSENKLKKLKDEKAAKERAEKEKREAEEAAKAEAARLKKSKDEYIVYVTPTGECYHELHCPRIKNSYSPIALKDAVGRFRPCKVCNPPEY